LLGWGSLVPSNAYIGGVPTLKDNKGKTLGSQKGGRRKNPVNGSVKKRIVGKRGPKMKMRFHTCAALGMQHMSYSGEQEKEKEKKNRLAG